MAGQRTFPVSLRDHVLDPVATGARADSKPAQLTGPAPRAALSTVIVSQGPPPPSLRRTAHARCWSGHDRLEDRHRHSDQDPADRTARPAATQGVTRERMAAVRDRRLQQRSQHHPAAGGRLGTSLPLQQQRVERRQPRLRMGASVRIPDRPAAGLSRPDRHREHRLVRPAPGAHRALLAARERTRRSGADRRLRRPAVRQGAAQLERQTAVEAATGGPHARRAGERRVPAGGALVCARAGSSNLRGSDRRRPGARRLPSSRRRAKRRSGPGPWNRGLHGGPDTVADALRNGPRG